MANKLGIDLAGKIIVMEGNCLEEDRTVKVEDGTDSGFGARPYLSGTALFVRFWNGKAVEGGIFRVSGYEVEKVLEPTNA